MRQRNLRMVAVAAALMASTSAFAGGGTPVPTAGDPFPSGTIVDLTPTPPGSVFTSPFGTFSDITLSNFGSATFSAKGGNQYYTYSGANGPSFTTTFSTIGTQTFTDGTFEVEILGRTNGTLGTFSAKLIEATFSGVIGGHNVVAEISDVNPSTGTVTYSVANNELLVATSFTVNGGYTVDGSPFNSTPLVGNSAIPEPSTWAMMALGFAGVGFAYRRSRKGALAAA